MNAKWSQVLSAIFVGMAFGAVATDAAKEGTMSASTAVAFTALFVLVICFILVSGLFAFRDILWQKDADEKDHDKPSLETGDTK